jgi:hypothetical protein
MNDDTDQVLHCAACLRIGTVHDSRCIESRALVTSRRAQAIIMICAAVILSFAACLMAACGDNWEPAVKIGVRAGQPTCVEVDAEAIREVACDGGTQ